jgi:hypothetical protein
LGGGGRADQQRERGEEAKHGIILARARATGKWAIPAPISNIGYHHIWAMAESRDGNLARAIATPTPSPAIDPAAH